MSLDDLRDENKRISLVESEIETEVSLHTLTNVSNPWIFHFTATYHDHSIEVLIDTGSHNNFIQEGLVEKLGLASVHAKQFRVYMGNGQYLLCDRMCLGIPLVL